MKKVISFALALVMLVSLPCTAFASEANTELVIEENGTNSAIVKSDGVTEIITVVEDDTSVTVTILNENTGVTEQIIRNKVTNVVYSTITGKKVTVDVPSDGDVSLQSVTVYETHYLSYAELRSIIGDNASVTGLASLILTLVPGVNTVANVVGMIATVVGGVATIAIPNDSNHGLVVSTKVVKYYRGTTTNKHVYKKVTTILSIAKY